MIIVRLRGGLGNQLFQYAAGKALADHHKTELALDLYTYTRHRYRKFELSRFNIEAREASRSEVHQYTGSNPISRYLNKRANYRNCPRVFAQPHYHYYEGFFSLPDDLYLSGYWQSEKYFAPVIPVLRSHFSLREALDRKNQELVSKMRSEESVAIHVRRGDYASSTAYQSFFGLVSQEYYQHAITQMRSGLKQPVCYFFSDNVEWCRQNFSEPGAVFVDHNSGDNSYKDLLLMSACRHNIIANSTFSWWGAWLNDNPGKKVIAPAEWFRSNFLAKKEPVYASRFYDTKDLIPQGWTRL